MLQKKVRINSKRFVVKAAFILLGVGIATLLTASPALALNNSTVSNPSAGCTGTVAGCGGSSSSSGSGSTTPTPGCYIESVGSTGGSSSNSSGPSSFNSSHSNSAMLSSSSEGRNATIILASKRTVAVIPGSPNDSTSTSGSGAPSTTAPSSSSSSSSDSGATVTFNGPNPCPQKTYDAGGFLIDGTKYCYVNQGGHVDSTDSSSALEYTQEPCTSLVCQEGSQAIANDNDPNIDCTPGDSDYCSGNNSQGQPIPPADQSEQCSSDCGSSSSSSGSGDNGNSSGGQTALCNSIVKQYIDPIIQFLGIGVGIVIVIMVVIGGIQYATAGDNPQAIQDAKGRIFNALIALVVFGLLYAFLNWLLPGGLF
jgi:hypothetical protein